VSARLVRSKSKRRGLAFALLTAGTMTSEKPGALQKMWMCLLLALVLIIGTASASFADADKSDASKKPEHKTPEEIAKAEADPAFIARVKELHARIQSDPKVERNYTDLANSYFLVGDYSQAATLFKKAVTISPKDVEAYRAVASSCDMLGDPRTAVQYLSKAISLSPNGDLFYFRGNVRKRYHDYEGMVSDMTVAIKFEPNNADYYLLRSCGYGLMNDWKSLIADATEAIRLNPKLGKAYLVRAKAYDALGQSAKRDSDLKIGTELTK